MSKQTDNDKTPTASTAPIADARVTESGRRVSAIWIVPIVAVLLGIWLVYNHYASLGPVATVRFETAEGVVAGKTKVLRRSVDVGLVESVRLSEDLKSVVMELRINADAAGLLREDTRFWVVRPRIGGAGVSGLGTIVSGAYIEIDPGSSESPRKEFAGLEQPPVTPQGVPGLRLNLIADEAGSLGPGAPVVYKGIKVGRIESRTFEYEDDQVVFQVFIEEPYEKLVARSTRFWNTTGIDLEMNSDGFRVRTGSLETMLAGGVEFDAPETEHDRVEIVDGAEFRLYDSRSSVEEVVLKPRLSYLLMFKDSVRGLNEEAPVEFRGIRVGKVTGISFEYVPGDPERRVPVQIRLDPAAIGEAPVMTKEEGAELIAESVKNGLRATLKTGNMLTGQLFVNLILDPEAEPAEVGTIGNFRTLPTASSGLARLEDKLVLALEKIQKLPVEDTLAGATEALAEISSAAKTLNATSSEIQALLVSDGIQNLPSRIDTALLELNKTMSGFAPESLFYRDLTDAAEELRDSLRSIKVLAASLDRKPNSIIFGRDSGKIQPPRAKQ